MRLIPGSARQWRAFGARWAAIGVVLALALAYSGCMSGTSHKGPLPALTAEERAVADNLRLHVYRLGEQIGERNVRKPDKLEEAAVYIERCLGAGGRAVTSQTFTAGGMTVRNLIAEQPGAARPEEIVVVGAHYDTADGTPGSNDNAAGVAAVLEISRLLAGTNLARTVRFAAFVNEEPPFFQTAGMGSLVYARECRRRGEKIVGMLSLETIGYYDDRRKTQRYPFPFSLLYPDTGNFIGFIGNMKSRKLLRRALGSFRAHAAFPSEGCAAPGAITGVGWSDHWAFWQAGYRAIMITDTAPFRYPQYHQPGDTPGRIDYERTARVAAGVARVVADLASTTTAR